MAGNVYEWVSSDYCSYSAKGCIEAAGVLRGGSWDVVSRSNVRASNRIRFDRTYRLDLEGFRCAR